MCYVLCYTAVFDMECLISSLIKINSLCALMQNACSCHTLFPAVSVVKPTPNLIACTSTGGRARNKTVQTDKCQVTQVTASRFLFSFVGWFTRLVAVAVRLPVGDAVLLRHVPRVGQNIWYNIENIYTNDKILE